MMKIMQLSHLAAGGFFVLPYPFPLLSQNFFILLPFSSSESQ